MLRNTSDKSRIFYLALYSLIAAFLAGAILALLGLAYGADSMNLGYLRISIFLQDILVIFLPAYLVFYYSFEQSWKSLGFVKSNNLPKLLLYALLIFIVSMPSISVLARWNELISFPPSLSKLEVMFRDMEDSALAVTDRFLAGKSWWELLLNLGLIAVLAGFVEEVFFRGALQKLIQRWFINGHVAVWSAAFIFSLIHLQFYGFFPRLLMGAILGYLYLYSGNIWVPIFAHFANNASVVLNNYFLSDTEIYDKMENLELNWAAWFVMLLSLYFTAVLLRKMKQQSISEPKHVIVEKQSYIKTDIK